MNVKLESQTATIGHLQFSANEVKKRATQAERECQVSNNQIDYLENMVEDLEKNQELPTIKLSNRELSSKGIPDNAEVENEWLTRRRVPYSPYLTLDTLLVTRLLRLAAEMTKEAGQRKPE